MRAFRLWSDQRGNSVVEMALVAPVLATLLVGTVDISRAVSTKLQLEQAAQRAIELTQRSDYSTSMDATLKSEAETGGGSGSTATVTSWIECDHSSTHLAYSTGSCSSGQSIAGYVQVTVTKSFTPMFGTRFFPGANANGSVTVTGKAVIRTL